MASEEFDLLKKYFINKEKENIQLKEELEQMKLKLNSSNMNCNNNSDFLHFQNNTIEVGDRYGPQVSQNYCENSNQHNIFLSANFHQQENNDSVMSKEEEGQSLANNMLQINQSTQSFKRENPDCNKSSKKLVVCDDNLLTLQSPGLHVVEEANLKNSRNFKKSLSTNENPFSGGKSHTRSKSEFNICGTATSNNYNIASMTTNDNNLPQQQTYISSKDLEEFGLSPLKSSDNIMAIDRLDGKNNSSSIIGLTISPHLTSKVYILIFKTVELLFRHGKVI
jgi:hypothetical protein